jgi:hypothetical protein
MNCAACNHYLARGLTLSKASPQDKRTEVATGICRRHPPTALYDPDDQDILSVFPTVHRDQRCGEYEPKGGWQSPC